MKRFFAALTIPIILAGCTTEMPIPVAPAIRTISQPPSGMSVADTALRRSLLVSATPITGAFYYRPVARCYFSEQTVLATGGNASRTSTITVKPVRNRLMITATAGTGATASISTLLIDPQGQLYDYNVVNMVTNRRTTPESFAADARRSLAELRAKYGGQLPPGAHILKGATVAAAIHPAFRYARRYRGVLAR